MSLEIAIKELREKVKNSELELKEIHRLCAESVNDRLFRLNSLVNDIDENLKKECSENDIDVCISSPGYLNLSRCDETNYKSLNCDLLNLKHIYWRLSTGLVTLDVGLYTSYNENEYFFKIYADNVDTYEIFNDTKKIYKQSRTYNTYNTYTSSTNVDALEYKWSEIPRGTKIGEQGKEYSYRDIAQESVFNILKRHLFEFETRKKETYDLVNNSSITFSNNDTGILGSNNLTIRDNPIFHGKSALNCNSLTISACPAVGCNYSNTDTRILGSNNLTIRSNPIFHGKSSLTISENPTVVGIYDSNKRELSINEAFRSRFVSLDEDK